jgi:hypothetical protein
MKEKLIRLCVWYLRRCGVRCIWPKPVKRVKKVKAVEGGNGE